MISRIQHFNIAFYAMIMGFWWLTLASLKLEHTFHWDMFIGKSLLFFTCFLFVIISIFYLLKILYFPIYVKKDFYHPIKSNFFPWIGKIFLILAIWFLWISEYISLILWLAGIIIQFSLTLIIFRRWILEEMDIKILNPLWFLPVVWNMMTPIAGVPLWFIEISWFFFSIGIMMWGVIFTILMNRILFHQSLPEKLFPTLTILIAPPVIAMIALIVLWGWQLTELSKILYYFALFLFLLLITNISTLKRIPFYMSWWALSFPLAVFTSGTFIMFEKTWQIFFQIFGLSLYILLVFVMIFLIYKTIHAMQGKEICIDE